MTDASTDRPTNGHTDPQNAPAPTRAVAEAKSGPASGSVTAPRVIALLGNPNVGKTTLFNRLAGLRQKTANFPGTTQEAHVGQLVKADKLDTQPTLIDLPGVYSLELDSAEAGVCRGALEGSAAPEGTKATTPDVLLVVLDSTNLLRNMTLLAQVARRGLPMLVAVNQIDAARRRGIHVDAEQLAVELGCPVVLTCAPTGAGVEDLRDAIADARPVSKMVPGDAPGIDTWADELHAKITSARAGEVSEALTDRLDDAFTHPILGIVMFAMIMTGLFYVIFSLAGYPMGWIETIFEVAGDFLSRHLPEGVLQDMLVNGVVAGVGGTVVFLPQIVLLFFLIALLEHTGYLARAAFVVDRLLRPFGLSGHAFVPLLSAHACALPSIMAARAVPDRRDRLATILIAPFMSCSARIPVYVLLTQILFPASPLKQAIAFTGCYVLGIIAGLLTSLLVRRTILKGKSRAMALELPPYRFPDLRLAVITAAERGWIFLRKAGTVILAISIVLWWLNTYPHAGPSAEADALRTRAAEVHATDPDTSSGLQAEAEVLDAQYAARMSFLGRIGTTIEPVFAPIGADRQLTIGILASFAAREVFAGTMGVQAAGSDDLDDESVREAITTMERDNGGLVFDEPTSWSMLVYFVLAMQCLPTLAVTAREAGGWKWAGLQFAWMSVVAYAGALIVFQALSALG